VRIDWPCHTLVSRPVELARIRHFPCTEKYAVGLMLKEDVQA